MLLALLLDRGDTHQEAAGESGQSKSRKISGFLVWTLRRVASVLCGAIPFLVKSSAHVSPGAESGTPQLHVDQSLS